MHAVLTGFGILGAGTGALGLVGGVVLLILSHAFAAQVLIGGGVGLAVGFPMLVLGLSMWSEHERAKEREL
tara:strand:- start:159 stop:371 length:213 start_codon:yes stop_codon:yes gene_type:complete